VAQGIPARFLDYCEGHAGLAHNGCPLTGEQIEVFGYGKSYTVRYFERVRLEYHHENAAPNDVLLGQFRRRMLSAAYVEIHD
jgi:hypothetical protein